VFNKIFGGGNEVIEDVQLSMQHARLVPLLAVFTAQKCTNQNMNRTYLPPRKFAIASTPPK
jgi:hypothetical protein